MFSYKILRGRSRRISRAKKVLSTPSFGGKIKPSVPSIRFVACKRSLNLRGSQNLGKITTGHLSRPQFHLSLLGSLMSLWMEAKVGTYKGGGKQWQTPPKNLPRMQGARAIPVTWLSCGSCQARPSRLNTNEWINYYTWLFASEAIHMNDTNLYLKFQL